MTATVIPPQEAAPAGQGAVYFTTEQLGELREAAERLERLMRSGAAPATGAAGAGAGTTQPADDAAAREAIERETRIAAVHEQIGALPATVRSGLRSQDDWRLVIESMRAAARAERNVSPELPLSEAALIRAGTKVLPAMLSAAGIHLPDGRLVRVSEAINTTEFPTLLRSGLRSILFNAFSGITSTWDRLVFSSPSNNQAEVWLEMSRLGILPAVGELEEYPEFQTTQLPQKRVSNAKYGGIIRISEEMVKFDKTNLILQIPRDRGDAAAQTLEDAAYTELRTAGRYDKSQTANDNNIGANTATVTFGPTGFLRAWETITTMKDPRAGRYLGIRPNVLICGSGVTLAATQLLRSKGVQSGEDGAGIGLPGVGDVNPFFGMVDEIITSPYMGRYEWILGVKGRGFVHQEVDPLTLTDKIAASDEMHFRRDAYEYKVRLWFGFGLYDTRFWFYSDSTTAPTWAS